MTVTNVIEIVVVLAIILCCVPLFPEASVNPPPLRG